MPCSAEQPIIPASLTYKLALYMYYRLLGIRGSSAMTTRCCSFPFMLRRRYYDLKLELLEVSLDISLACNALRLDMADAGPLVPEVCVQELGQNHVVVMFATATTVHRLVLPHPEAVLKVCDVAFCFSPN